MPAEPLLLDLSVTLEDQVRMNEWLLDQPELRRRRLLTLVLTVLLTPPLGILLGIGIAAMQDGDAFFWRAVGVAATDRGTLELVATIAVLLILLRVLARLLRRPLLRRHLRRLLPERPGVDLSDASLTEAAHVVVDADGFVSETVAGTARVPWLSIKELADIGPLFVVRTGRFSGYIIPKRDLSAAQSAMLRQVFDARAGQ